MNGLRRYEGEVELNNGTTVRLVVDLEPDLGPPEPAVVDVGADQTGRRLGYVSVLDRTGRPRACSPVVVIS